MVSSMSSTTLVKIQYMYMRKKKIPDNLLSTSTHMKTISSRIFHTRQEKIVTYVK